MYNTQFWLEKNQVMYILCVDEKRSREMCYGRHCTFF